MTRPPTEQEIAAQTYGWIGTVSASVRVNADGTIDATAHPLISYGAANDPKLRERIKEAALVALREVDL